MTMPSNVALSNHALIDQWRAEGRHHRVARPGSLVFILSDFYAIDADTRRHLQRLRPHLEGIPPYSMPLFRVGKMCHKPR